jgi:hypothetical protein
MEQSQQSVKMAGSLMSQGQHAKSNVQTPTTDTQIIACENAQKRKMVTNLEMTGSPAINQKLNGVDRATSAGKKINVGVEEDNASIAALSFSPIVNPVIDQLPVKFVLTIALPL